MKIAFIGLGIMGKPMAKNLLKAGHALRVYDRSAAALQEVEAAGAVACQSAVEAVEDVELVITMLPNSPHVRSVMLEDDQLALHMPRTAGYIDCSSINPMASREIAAELAKHGIDMLDAPVSGGEPKAIDGTLSLMVGGAERMVGMEGASVPSLLSALGPMLAVSLVVNAVMTAAQIVIMYAPFSAAYLQLKGASRP